MEYVIKALSKYTYPGSFLGHQIEKLIKEGLAIEGIPDMNQSFLIRILYDQYKNPYLLFKSDNEEEVNLELEKKLLHSEFRLASESFDSLISKIYGGEYHSEIQKEAVHPSLIKRKMNH